MVSKAARSEGKYAVYHGKEKQILFNNIKDLYQPKGLVSVRDAAQDLAKR